MAGASAIGKSLREHLSKVMRDTMLVAVENLRAATPVDTGHAMSNWVPSTKAPYDGVDGSKDSVSFSAQEAGIAALRAYDIGRDGPAIYIRNNVFYVQFLDRGHSQQAPAGFVAVALQAAAHMAPGPRRAAVAAILTKASRHAYLVGY